MFAEKMMSMKLRPIGNNIIVKGIQDDSATKAGIVLPDTADKGKPEKGEVIAVGPGKMLDNGQLQEMTVKVGDVVYFTRYSPNEIEIDDETYLVLSESDVLAIVENK